MDHKYDKNSNREAGEISYYRCRDFPNVGVVGLFFGVH